MRLGTSSVVVAAFVGPGTVLTCASSGIEFGYSLGWVVLFATFAVFVLQSYTAATGILAGMGLGEALRNSVHAPVPRFASFILVVLGLWVGCAAFETGNLIGAASGIAAAFDLDIDVRWLVAAIAAVAATLLALDVRSLIRVFTALVLVMSVLFISTLALAPVDWSSALRGLTTPRVPDDSIVTVIALIGTTVVTYNLFLHATATRRYWMREIDRAASFRNELRGMAVFMPVGGLISFSILAAGATLHTDGNGVTSVGELAGLLEPVSGSAARYLFGLGLFSAGITSAMTAPLAAAAGIRELFGWPDDDRSLRSRLIWGSVILAGLLFGLTDVSPLRVIIAAQAANGLLLPAIAGFMLYIAMRQQAARLPAWYGALGVLITLVCAGLGARTLWWVWTQIAG